MFSVGLFTTIYAYSLQPLYRSTATLLIGGDEAVTKSDSQSWANAGDYLKTQDQLIWSRKVAKRVLETQREVIVAHLETDSDFGFDWRDWVPQSLLGLAEPDQPPIAESDPDKELYDWLWNGLGVRNVFDTSIIQVSFDTTEPELAARIANAYTRA